MKHARILLIMMVLLVSPLFSIQTSILNIEKTFETKSLFFGEEVGIQNIRYSENSAIIDIVGIKPKKISLGKVFRTYSKSMAIDKKIIKYDKKIKTRIHHLRYYKNKIG